jgi:hypothetical protein
MILPTGKVIPPTGKVIPPTGKVIPPTGKVILPTGKVIPPTGKVILPTGKVILPTGKVILPAGKVILPTEQIARNPLFIGFSRKRSVAGSTPLPNLPLNRSPSSDERSRRNAQRAPSVVSAVPKCYQLPLFCRYLPPAEVVAND